MRNNYFCDVTLVRRDNQKLEVHKVILSVYINVFKNILASDMHPHPMIFMRGWKYSTYFVASSTVETKVANLGTERREEIGLVMVSEENKNVPTSIRTPMSPEEEATKEVKASLVKGLKAK